MMKLFAGAAAILLAVMLSGAVACCGSGAPTAPKNTKATLPPLPGAEKPAAEKPAEAVPAMKPIKFEEIIRNKDNKGWTDVQFEEYKKSLKGQRAENWQGSTVDVKQSALGDYYVEVDMPGTKDTVDVFVYIPKDTAMAMKKGQALTFSGVVDGLYPNFLGDWQVEVRDATIK